MKIGILQQNFIIGDFAGNAEKIITGYHEACGEGAEIVVSSELALFGYPPQDMLERGDYIAEHNRQFKRLAKQVGEIPLIVGIVEKNSGVGKPLFNSAVVVQNGHIEFSQRKQLLPTYDVFDEQRYFEPRKKKSGIFIHNGKRIAILICEDIWGNEGTGYELYRDSPVKEIVDLGADILIVINGSPYQWGKGDIRFSLVSRIAQIAKCAVIYSNQVGGNTELVFDGRSFAVNEKGRCLGTLPAFEERVAVWDTEDKTKILFHCSDKNNAGDLYSALILGSRDYIKKMKRDTRVLIGLSGGIDSAVVACIAKEALGSENILGVGMPSKYSSPESVKDAELLAKNLGIEFRIIPIGDIYEVFGKILEPHIGWFEAGSRKGDVTEENVQARVRGLILMAIANREGRVVFTTGNKSEISVGYCTLYGDTVGGFAVLSDIPKTLVYRLASFINRNKIIIPQNTFDKSPSAELAPEQKDSDLLPPYHILDDIIQAYIEKGKSVDEIVALGYSFEIVRKVISLINKAEFKRRQMPPGLKVTSKAFGSGRRWPIIAKYI